MKIDGRAIAKNIFDDLTTRVKHLKRQDIIPNLAIILIGDNPASRTYVQQKILKANEIGAQTTVKNLKPNIPQSKVLKTIEQWSNDSNIHGIIVQRPLPKHINSDNIARAINPKKDVDGLHLESKFEMPLSIAVLRILEHIFNSSIKGSHNLPAGRQDFVNWLKEKSVVIIGKGETGGKPIIAKLNELGVEPLIIDSKTENPKRIIKKADIIISAVGKPNIVRPEMIKKDDILISVGLYKGADGKLHGDYDEDEIKDIASFYTPTPGGVGPVNVACLLKNLISAAETTN